MENTVSFFVIPLSDFERGVKFYSSVFGKKLKLKFFPGQKMALFPSGNGGVRGALIHAKEYQPCKTGSIPYISFTEDINSILSRVTQEGGEVIVPPKTTLFGAEHKFAMFIDSEGNRIGIFRTYLD